MKRQNLSIRLTRTPARAPCEQVPVSWSTEIYTQVGDHNLNDDEKAWIQQDSDEALHQACPHLALPVTPFHILLVRGGRHGLAVGEPSSLGR